MIFQIIPPDYVCYTELLYTVLNAHPVNKESTGECQCILHLEEGYEKKVHYKQHVLIIMCIDKHLELGGL